MKIRGKLITIGAVLLFITLTIMTPVCGNISQSNTKPIEEDIMVFRFGPDGSIKRIDPNVETLDEQDFSDALYEKFVTISEEDSDLQSFVKSDTDIIKKVESKGKGFHFAIFRPMMRIKPVFRSVLMYRYFYDEDYTKVDNHTLAQGPHKARILGFVGYAGFSTRFFGRVVIYGYSTFRIDVDLA